MQLTTRGFLLLLITAPIMAVGTWIPVLQLVAGFYLLLAIGFIVFDLRQAGNIDQFDIERVNDTRLSLNAENRIRLKVINRTGRHVDIQLRDEPPDEFEVDVRILQGTVVPRLMWEESYYVRPLRRGDHTFGNINVRWSSPFRLVIKQGVVKADALVKVYPNLLEVRRYDFLLQRNRLQDFGLRNTRLFGEGNEFERLREYLPDDEYRRIDWKATARRHKPITIEYQTERSQNIMILVDVGRMMLSPVDRVAKLDYVINATLLLAYVSTGLGDKIGLMTFSDDVNHYLSPQAGRGQFYRMLERLYAVEPKPVEANYARALTYLGIKQRKRALVVLFTDMSGGFTMELLASQIVPLRRTSLPLVVTISDPDVVFASKLYPHDSQSVFEREAAAQLLEDRHIVLEKLHRQGVMTLDVPATSLSLEVISRYLELKNRGML